MTYKHNGNVVFNKDNNRNSQYIYVYTGFEMVSTGVKHTRQQLVDMGVLTSATLSASNSITLDGVTYTANATYDNAYWTNQNFQRVYRAVAKRCTIIAASVGNVNVSGDAMNTIRLPGVTAGAVTAGTASASAFGSDMVDDAEGVWYAAFIVEGDDYLAVAADQNRSISAVTSVDNIIAELAVVNGYFNTDNADANNEDAMGGSLSAGDAVSGLTSSTKRNIIAVVSEVVAV